MGDTCPICGRPNAGVWDGPDPKKCFQQLGDDCETCWRLGYEREKARADAAEADARFARLAEKERAKVQESFQAALAAARRECDMWKQIAGDLYTPLWERGFKCEPRMDGSHISVCGTFNAENCPLCMTDALADPEEGSR